MPRIVKEIVEKRSGLSFQVTGDVPIYDLKTTGVNTYIDYFVNYTGTMFGRLLWKGFVVSEEDYYSLCEGKWKMCGKLEKFYV